MSRLKELSLPAQEGSRLTLTFSAVPGVPHLRWTEDAPAKSAPQRPTQPPAALPRPAGGGRWPALPRAPVGCGVTLVHGVGGGGRAEPRAMCRGTPFVTPAGFPGTSSWQGAISSRGSRSYQGFKGYSRENTRVTTAAVGSSRAAWNTTGCRALGYPGTQQQSTHKVGQGHRLGVCGPTGPCQACPLSAQFSENQVLFLGVDMHQLPLKHQPWQSP